MSYLPSNSAFNHHELIHELSASRSYDQPPKPAQTIDRVMDAALRSVPLPEGLMTRLGKLVCTMPDEPADQMDWLGC